LVAHDFVVVVLFALQLAVLHQLLHAHDQFHGHVQLTVLVVHAEHKFVVGFVVTLVAFTLQHNQLINHIHLSA
jgi:hypothetical protein